MDLHPRRIPAKIYRRSGGRLPLRIHAQLLTRSRTFTAVLVDISRRGASFSVKVPPGRGETALARWRGKEVLGSVEWSSQDHCGISFTQALSEQVLRDALALNDASPAPEDESLESEAARAWVEGSKRFGFE